VATVTGSEWAKTVHALDRAATVTGSEWAKTVHALDRAATVTGSKRAKTVHALDRAATVTSSWLHWFYLITATHFGPSSGSFIKYISRYWNIQE
jgi:hypothetical protein